MSAACCATYCPPRRASARIPRCSRRSGICACWCSRGSSSALRWARYGIGIWLPLILKEYHLTNLAIGWTVAIPYLFASIGMIVWARYVDRTGHRIVNLAIACLLGAAGLVAPILSGSLTMALIGFSVALIVVSAARAVFWALPTRFLTGVAAAGGLAFINSIGTVGGFAGPSMMGWLREVSGSYVVGLTAVAVIMVAATIASMSLKLVGSKE